MSEPRLPTEDERLPIGDSRAALRYLARCADRDLGLAGLDHAEVAQALREGADEIERWQKLYEIAVRGRAEFRKLVREMRDRIEAIP